MSGQDQPKPKLDEIGPITPRSLPFGNLFVSALGRHYQASRDPLIVYGHDALDAAAFFAQASTLTTLAISSLDKLDKAMPEFDAVGIYALSRPDHSGEAQDAVRRFRQAYGPSKAALYGAWTADVHQACVYAAECGADGVLMPDCNVDEMFAYIFGVIQAADRGDAPPENAEEHVRRLKAGFQHSPFWRAKNPGRDDIY